MARRGKMGLWIQACFRGQAARNLGMRFASTVVFWRPREQDPKDLAQREVNFA